MSLIAVLALVQLAALMVLLVRLAPGRTRLAPVQPGAETGAQATVSVIVATLNEAARIAPCLAGLRLQGNVVREILFVDSNSTDGTRELIMEAQRLDARIQLLTDTPRPDDWIGKVWALETGRRQARGEWILGIDADTVPERGMVSGILDAMERGRYDAASFGPKFVGQSAAERWLQPAMLVTLVYRCGAAGAETPPPNRVLANGQCFMVRKSSLDAHGGYSVARHSFSDDVTLARHLAWEGERVGFLDGREIISVRAYRSAREMWREWGRSFDLADSTTRMRRWMDVAFIWLTMALPVPVLVLLGLREVIGAPSLSANTATGYGAVIPGAFSPATTNAQPADSSVNMLDDMLHKVLHIDDAVFVPWLAALVTINALLLCVRILLMVAIRTSYAERGVTFWMSAFADIPAAVRLTISTAKRPRMWRGRRYTGRAN